MEPEEDGLGPNRPKFGFRIYENFRNIVKKSRSNYDLSEAIHCPTYEVDTVQDFLSKLDIKSSMSHHLTQK